MDTVIVSIHGIGFQVPPKDTQGIEGYADQLHHQLREDSALGDQLGDDPDRIKDGVREALLRLAYRPDVDGIIVNSHSQGTAVAFDVLRDFPVVAKDRIKALVTAGSPLRKYVDLFAWGSEIGCLYGIDGEEGTWNNFWDKRDPVADPLKASAHWQPGRPPEPKAGDELFHAYKRDTGELLPYHRLSDAELNNLKNSYGGGLQAHNYWDNQSEFIPQFVSIVRSAARLG